MNALCEKYGDKLVSGPGGEERGGTLSLALNPFFSRPSWPSPPTSSATKRTRTAKKSSTL